jgi:hypothetical protein
MPLARVQSLSRVDVSARAPNDESSRVGTNGPSMGFVALRRMRRREATHTGFTSPGCAAPSGFLNLLTRCSARPVQPCFMLVTPLGFGFQRFPPPSSRHASRRALPLMLSSPAPKRRTAAPGIGASGRSVRDGPVLPGIHRPILSKPCSPRGFHPSGPRPRASTKPPLMGLGTPLSVVASAIGRKRPHVKTGHRRACSVEYQ